MKKLMVCAAVLRSSRTTDRDPRAASVSSWSVWRCGLAACALLSAAASLQGATITYNAAIGCQQSCVTVSMSWAGEPFGVNFADVEDQSDNVLFALNLGTFAGQSTGAIVPFPQTISSLSSNTISLISSGQAYLSLSVVAPGLLGGGEGAGSDGTPFLVEAVPEPGAGWLAAAGLGVLLLRRVPATQGRGGSKTCGTC